MPHYIVKSDSWIRVRSV